ncbi:hypothetical protein [Conexibacter woesei]|uniref:hypothetical protein n=1 Tax=Conexibacter woesei TaxID=191495 RepID=UPI0012DE4F6B|nr:hypothetical protein [Conexibacter woesei]
MKDPAHNRFKAPFWALMVVVFVVLAVLYAVAGMWWLAVVWVVCAVGAEPEVVPVVLGWLGGRG